MIASEGRRHGRPLTVFNRRSVLCQGAVERELGPEQQRNRARQGNLNHISGKTDLQRLEEPRWKVTGQSRRHHRGNIRNGPGNRQALCDGRRLRVYHRAPPGTTECGGQRDRPECLRRPRRCWQPRRSRPVVRTVKAQKGHIDVLYASAGLASSMCLSVPSLKQTSTTSFNVNVRGTLFTVQKALPLMAMADRSS